MAATPSLEGPDSASTRNGRGMAGGVESVQVIDVRKVCKVVSCLTHLLDLASSCYFLLPSTVSCKIDRHLPDPSPGHLHFPRP
ncbi:hypothetical protein M413DRAFT_289579 [Hebeloma cylindrosporum]|uniref:Uncharacterized protein n=1 Tax=Hebeloma cylindrosporum TaxID=76867 RepID=A0A0C2Y5T0_HEBCY|nr:hypothetical protein M413DRAFT_289579 [Hebeloma cylindrosporum h7]